MDKAKLRSLLITSDTSLKKAMRKLSDTGERILFVIGSNDKLIGTITDGDIRRGIINNIKFSDPVKKIMFRHFIHATSDSPEIVRLAKSLMVENKVEQIPVLDKKGAIIDVILWTDVIYEKARPSQKRLHKNHVVIMAGGKGSRLDPFTKILPKPLIPIGEKPVIEVIMEKFYRFGFHKFTYTLNYKKEYLKLFLRENNFAYTIDMVEEEDFMGTAGSLSLLKDKIKDSFFIVNCDSVVDVDYGQVLKWHKEHEAAITIIGCHNEVKIPFGVLQMSGGRLKKILEKPVQDVIVNTGVYVMEPDIISLIPNKKHMDMNTLIDSVARKRKVAIYPICGGWFDMGQWSEYKKNLYMLEQDKIFDPERK